MKIVIKTKNIKLDRTLKEFIEDYYPPATLHSQPTHPKNENNYQD